MIRMQTPSIEAKLKEKRWNPSAEKRLWKTWIKEKTYSFNLDTDKRIFSIDTPPPYPSGRPWHVGAAAHYSQIDMIARTARMMGFEVYFPIGIDRNGMPVELYTERKYKVRMHETSREKFIELCMHALDDLEAEMIQIMKNMGMSGDFDDYYRTDSEDYRKLTQATFIELWHRGLIYEDTRPNNYCVDCRTTLADADIVYEEQPTLLVHVNFRIRGVNHVITVATTRPELLCSCQALIVNPEDSRYRDLPRKYAMIPIYERAVPILSNPAARPEFGTGVMMVCSYGDYSDVQLFRELGLKEIIAVNTDGKMTEKAGKYQKQTIKECRTNIISDLERDGLIVKKEKIMHRTPICERSKTPIEIVPMKEYYLRQIEFLKDVREIAEKVSFHPEAHRQILLNWINSVAIDWPISRRRYYGTEVPIWYCNHCGKPTLPDLGRYYKPWRDPPPYSSCPHCGSTVGFKGDERTFDTWFDSSISPLFISGYLRDSRRLAKLYPNSIRPQAKDIIRTWLYYTLLRCYQLTGKSSFEHVWIMGYGVDEKGERMSKSKGNVIDPLPLLENLGADAFRFWNAEEASLGSDFRCSERKIAGSSKFLTKLWNICRFVSTFPEPETAQLTETDEWILAELDRLVQECLRGYSDFNFFIPANRIREFVWGLFAPHYLEMAKARSYGKGFDRQEQEASWYTFHRCLRTLLVLLAPITPFIVDHVWRELYGARTIHGEMLPQPRRQLNEGLISLTSKIVDFNSEVWNRKKKCGVSLKSVIHMAVPNELRSFEKDLVAMHNLINSEVQYT